MPIHIKELVIRNVIEADPQPNPPAAEKVSPSNPIEDREALIEACVARVMKLLKYKKER